mmetsp:Transcript_40321/g.51966  ORF Transcript_40321/g.51966 Transcript_40321/m.51966 type:complete len:248 (-) Transcript_40321:347-1090(-)
MMLEANLTSEVKGSKKAKRKKRSPFLTKKQIWRKIRSYGKKRGHSSEDWETILRGEIYKWDSSLKKMQKIHTWNTGISDHRSVSSETRSKSCVFGLRKRRVGFDPKVRMAYVPFWTDCDSVSKSTVWWTEDELMEFKMNAFEYYEKHGHLSYTLEEEKMFEIAKDEGKINEITQGMELLLSPHESVDITLASSKFSFVDESFFLEPSSNAKHFKKALSSSNIEMLESKFCSFEQNARCHSWPKKSER